MNNQIGSSTSHRNIQWNVSHQIVSDMGLSESPLSSPTLCRPHPKAKFSIFASSRRSKFDSRFYRWTLILDPGNMPNINETTAYFVDAASEDKNEFRCTVYDEPCANTVTSGILRLGRTNKSEEELKNEISQCAKRMTVASLNEPGGWRWILAVLDEILVVKPLIQSCFGNLDEVLGQIQKLEKIKLVHHFLSIATPTVADALRGWDARELSQSKDCGKNIMATYAQPCGYSKFTWMLFLEDQADRGLCISLPAGVAGQPVVVKIMSQILSFWVGRHSSSLEQWGKFLEDLSCSQVIPDTTAGLWIPPLLIRVIKGPSGHGLMKRLEAVFRAMELGVIDMGLHKEHTRATRTYREASRNQKLEAQLLARQHQAAANHRFEEKVNWIEKSRDEAVKTMRDAHDTKTHCLMGFLEGYEEREEEEDEIDWRKTPMNSHMRSLRQKQEQEKLALKTAACYGRSFRLLPPKGG